jgi:hypothetical protein
MDYKSKPEYRTIWISRVLTMTIINEENKKLENKMISNLFDENTNKKSLIELLNNIKDVPLSRTEFQIHHFVLNEKEFPTEWSKFQQIKLELHTGIQSLMDMYFRLEEAQTHIELLKAQIEELQLQTETSKINAVKIKLKQINIDKNKFRILSIYHTAQEKLKEIMIFYDIFNNLKELNYITHKDNNIMEEETWKIRSMYNAEFKNRYGLTPEGFIHEEKGSQAQDNALKGGVVHGRQN